MNPMTIAEKRANEYYPELNEQDDVAAWHGFIAGYEQAKKDMLKEAVEGEVVKDISNKLAVTAKINLDGFKFGDKVRVIVLKKEN